MNNPIKRSAFGIILMCLFSVLPSDAQILTIQEKKISLDEGAERTAVQLVCEQSVATVREAFDEYMDDYHDVKMNTGNLFGKHRIIEAEEIQLDAVSPKEMNLYVRIIELGDKTELSAFGSFGPDVHISEDNYPEAYEKINDLVEHFTSVFVPKYFRQTIIASRDDMADIRDDITDAERDIAKNNEKIERLKEDNHELEGEIAEFKKALEEGERALKELKEKRSKSKARVNEIRKS